MSGIGRLMRMSRHSLILRVACLLVVGLTGSDRSGFAAQLTKGREVSLEGIGQWAVFDSGGWAIVQNSRVHFYGSGGDERRALELRGKEVLAYAPESDAIGVLVYADQQPTTLRVKQFDLYNYRGEKRLSLDDPGFASAIISPAGNGFAGLWGAEGLPETEIRFYDDRGLPHDSLRVKHFEGGRYCRDGSHFLFVTAAAGLEVAAADGRVLYTLGPADVWGSSAEGRTVGITRGEALGFYRDGQPIGTLSWPKGQGRLRALAISPDGSCAAVISATHVALARLDSLGWVWTHAAEDTSWNFRSVDLARIGSRVIVGLDFDPGAGDGMRHQKSRCRIFDRDGTVLATEEGNPQTWGAMFPQVRLDDDGRRAVFIDRDMIRWFSFQ